ncbi:MAG: tetratricopeptide repeat protein [Prochlorococcus sp.]
MNTSKTQRNQISLLWAEMQGAVDDHAWAEAEGLLWRILQVIPKAPCSVWDTLGYVLLMQGDYRTCEQVLRPFSQAPDRTFWMNHKLADAMRGQNRYCEAAELYRRSLSEGSDSELTYRNLLQVLYELQPSEALEELQRWTALPDLSDAARKGALAAAALVPGMELSQWLWEHGHHDGACRRRLLEEHCYALSPSDCWKILEQVEEPTPWERALKQKLLKLRLRPVQAATGSRVVGEPPLQHARQQDVL